MESGCSFFHVDRWLRRELCQVMETAFVLLLGISMASAVLAHFQSQRPHSLPAGSPGISDEINLSRSAIDGD